VESKTMSFFLTCATIKKGKTRVANIIREYLIIKWSFIKNIKDS